MLRQLLNLAKAVEAIPATIAGTTTISGNIIDTAGYEGVVFFFFYGAGATNNTGKIEHGDDSGLSDAADVAGSTPGAANSEFIQVVDIYKPQKRYHRAVAARGTSSTIQGIALLYGPRTQPAESADAAEVALARLVSPATGTP